MGAFFVAVLQQALVPCLPQSRTDMVEQSSMKKLYIPRALNAPNDPHTREKILGGRKGELGQ